MALIEHYLDITVNKVELAVERVRLANLSKEPLYLCYSGGKDSKVVRRICEMAGVPFETHYNLTTVDHPSVVQEIKAESVARSLNGGVVKILADKKTKEKPQRPLPKGAKYKATDEYGTERYYDKRKMLLADLDVTIEELNRHLNGYATVIDSLGIVVEEL